MYRIECVNGILQDLQVTANTLLFKLDVGGDLIDNFILIRGLGPLNPLRQVR